MGFKFPDLPPLLTGETVTVLTPTVSFDAHMNERVEWADEAVDGVIVAPGSTTGMSDGMRPHGTRSVFTLAFPKTFAAPLRGCRVSVRGREYAVVRDPQPNTAENCPGPWWYTAEAEAVDG